MLSLLNSVVHYLKPRRASRSRWDFTATAPSGKSEFRRSPKPVGRAVGRVLAELLRLLRSRRDERPDSGLARLVRRVGRGRPRTRVQFRPSPRAPPRTRLQIG